MCGPSKLEILFKLLGKIRSEAKVKFNENRNRGYLFVYWANAFNFLQKNLPADH
jgi:hypothetical protein